MLDIALPSRVDRYLPRYAKELAAANYPRVTYSYVAPRIYHALPVSLTNTTPPFRSPSFTIPSFTVFETLQKVPLLQGIGRNGGCLHICWDSYTYLVHIHHIDTLVPIESFLHLYTQCQITYPQKQSPFRSRPALQHDTTCSLRIPFTHPLLDIRLLLMSRLAIPLYKSTLPLSRSISSPIIMTHGYTCLC
jgi:hypothetical protein